jgi:membrane protease YdiL (CAAX protease family)
MDSTTPGARDARRLVVIASLGFAALLLGGAWLLLRVRGASPPSVFDSAFLWARLAIGAGIGLLAGVACACIVARARSLERVRLLAREAIDGIEPRWHTMLAVALAAGFSEELFFRGALEPVVGRAFTALGFVAMHGALRVRSRGGAALAAFLFAASLGLSTLCAWRGLEAAMAAHAAYDLAVLVGLRRGVARRRRRGGGRAGGTEAFD